MSDTQPQLTQKQQQLMEFLNQLATTPMAPEKLGFPKSDWCIYDSGQSLELTTELYNQISQTAEFQAFESIGGHYSIEDNNPYLPEFDGISLATISAIFED